VNNLFINQNWVGEDYENTLNRGADPEKPMMTSTMNLDTLTREYGHINAQPEFLLPDGTVDPAKCGLDKMKIFISNNVQYTDTILNAYYKNYGHKYNNYTDHPVSFLTWSGGTPPFDVINIPCIWMNERTQALIDAYLNMVENENYIEQEVQTVTPAIKDMDVIDQMAWWNDAQWGVPGVHANDITHSDYIFGDYDPSTIPGYKTENGDGITKFTDLNENFSQTGKNIYISKIDGFPIGSLIWDDTQNDYYNSSEAYAKVKEAYRIITGIQTRNNATPQKFELSQNYPNPFNPTTQIEYHIPVTVLVTLIIYDLRGKEVKTLQNEEKKPGNYTITWDGRDMNGKGVSSGIYFYQLKAGSLSQVRKLIFVK
jgi:hypothetical protein